jgi:hypothetical protein
MILLHRLTPPAIALTGAAGLAGLMYWPVSPFWPAGLGLGLTLLLLMRLGEWKTRTFSFWVFVGTPTLFLLAALGMFMFLENDAVQLGLMIGVGVLLFLWSEHLFNYLHLPANYQAYALEHLALAFNVLTVFFVSASAFGLNLFLQPNFFGLTMIVVGFFLLSLFIIYSTLWVSKVERAQAWPYALAGAVLITEFFSVVTFLPSGFYSGAAFVTVVFYVFLGLTRAWFMDKLSRTVYWRYVLVAAAIIGLLAGAASWF